MTEQIKLEGWTFAQMPVWALVDPALDDGSRTLMCYLIWRQGHNPGSWPSVALMKTNLGVSETTVIRRIETLEKAGYLHVNRRHGRSSVYTIIAQPEQAASIYKELTTCKTATTCKNASTTTCKNASALPPTTCKNARHNDTVNSNKNHDNHTSACVENPKPTVTSIIPSERPVVTMSGAIPAGDQEPELLIEEDSPAPVGAKIDDPQAIIPSGYEDLFPNDGSTHIDPRQPKQRSAEDAKQDTIRSLAAYNVRDWLAKGWGEGSEALHKRMQRVEDHKPIIAIGVVLSAIGLEPAWSKRASVSFWIDKIEELLEIAHGDKQIVARAITEAVRDNKARGYPITFSGPQSFQGAVHKEMMMLTGNAEQNAVQVPRITADEWGKS